MAHADVKWRHPRCPGRWRRKESAEEMDMHCCMRPEDPRANSAPLGCPEDTSFTNNVRNSALAREGDSSTVTKHSGDSPLRVEDAGGTGG